MIYFTKKSFEKENFVGKMAKGVAILFMVIILLLCICNINGLQEEKENSDLLGRKLLRDTNTNDPPPTRTPEPTPQPSRPTRKPRIP